MLYLLVRELLSGRHSAYENPLFRAVDISQAKLATDNRQVDFILQLKLQAGEGAQ